eukprot:gb/GECG01014199.1/.p1 GENE.gb/GECG01014199.1/~~gb/GECG01014199.1/.p1  ORF type:complete len:349 (+),score=44.16 gb/GECG01014199.1/:1-1047(+)
MSHGSLAACPMCSSFEIQGPGSDRFMKQPSLKLHSGEHLPCIGLGTWKSEKSKVYQAVLSAVRCGYRHIDAAAVYGNEAEIGEALQELFRNKEVTRKELFITSKLWVTHCDPVDVKEMLGKTLEDLQLEYLDLYLIHWPYFLEKGTTTFPPPVASRKGYSRSSVTAVWRVLEEEVENGRLRNIGVSNMSVPKLKSLLEDARIQPAANQVELHPYLQQKSLVKFCQDNRIAVIAYAPLGSPDRPDFYRESTDDILLENDIIVSIATKHDCTPAQILIRFAIERGTAVIPKSVTPARIDENIQSLKIELDMEDMEKLKILDVHLRYLKGAMFAPEGEHWKHIWDEEVDES